MKNENILKIQRYHEQIVYALDVFQILHKMQKVSALNFAVFSFNCFTFIHEKFLVFKC